MDWQNFTVIQTIDITTLIYDDKDYEVTQVGFLKNSAIKYEIAYKDRLGQRSMTSFVKPKDVASAYVWILTSGNQLLINELKMNQDSLFSINELTEIQLTDSTQRLLDMHFLIQYQSQVQSLTSRDDMLNCEYFIYLLFDQKLEIYKT